MNFLISVVLCTHNPRKDYFERTLEALEDQTLPTTKWELLIVDNASKPVLSEAWRLDWHPNGRHVQEPELGLTQARLRGIKSSSGEVIVFVDDDNVLDPDYLECVVAIANSRPYIGAFGASVRAEFEAAPSDVLGKYLCYLAVDELDNDYWSNVPVPSKALPFGAGLCVRRAVAERYCSVLELDQRRKRLGRIGSSLGSHEDHDLALCAIDLGLGTGRFCALRLTHLISAGRVTEDYIVRIVAGGSGTNLVLNRLRSLEDTAPQPGWVTLAKLTWHLARANSLERKIIRASHRVQMETRALLDSDLFV